VPGDAAATMKQAEKKGVEQVAEAAMIFSQDQKETS
jgi:hypothetical protein